MISIQAKKHDNYSVEFISESKTPAEVLELRDKSSFVEDESHIFEEKILLYRKHVTIDDRALSAGDNYPMHGINEVMRLHLTRFTQKIYYMNLVFQLQHDSDVRYHHFRITMTRNGVLSIEEI